MRLDKALAFLVLASVSGALIFMLGASSEYLFTTSESAREQLSKSVSVAGNTYINPVEKANLNGSSNPIYNSEGNIIFYEERMSNSEYAHLEDQRQFDQR